MKYIAMLMLLVLAGCATKTEQFVVDAPPADIFEFAWTSDLIITNDIASYYMASSVEFGNAALTISFEDGILDMKYTNATQAAEAFLKFLKPYLQAELDRMKDANNGQKETNDTTAQ